MDVTSLCAVLGISEERETAIRSELVNNESESPEEDIVWVRDNPGYTLSEKIYLTVWLGVYFRVWC